MNGAKSGARTLAIVAALVLAGTEAWASSDADKCEAAKNKVAGKYAFCRQKAEAKAVKTGDPVDYSKCDANYSAKWFSSTASSYFPGWVDDARIYRTALSDAQVAALVPCFAQAVLTPPSSFQFAGTISVDASQTEACGKPLRYFWHCSSSDSAGCNAFMSAANADGNTHPTAPLNAVAGVTYVIDLTAIVFDESTQQLDDAHFHSAESVITVLQI